MRSVRPPRAGLGRVADADIDAFIFGARRTTTCDLTPTPLRCTARQIRLRRLVHRPRLRVESPHTAHTQHTLLPLPRSPFPCNRHFTITHLRFHFPLGALSTSSDLSPDHTCPRHTVTHPFSSMSVSGASLIVPHPESHNSILRAMRVPGPSPTGPAAAAQAQCLNSTVRFANAAAITRGSGIPRSTYASHSPLGKTVLMRFTRVLSTCAGAWVSQAS